MTSLAFITGATSGIGEACAHLFAEKNFNLIITGRRQDRLEKLKTELLKKFNIQIATLCFDVTKKDQVFNALESLPVEFQSIDILINNAGLSQDLTPLQDGSIDDWDRMIDTNIKGLLYVSKAIMPWMIAKEKGHIINISSIAGKETYPNNNAYCASKYAVESISKTMRVDLLKHNIKVTNIAPGAVNTEFSTVRFKGDKNRADSTYNGFTPLNAKDIADAIFYCASLPSHVNINDMVIMPTAQASTGHFHKNL